MLLVFIMLVSQEEEEIPLMDHSLVFTMLVSQAKEERRFQ
jgi:hypothetical protein